MKLCQVTALLTGKKTTAIQALTNVYHRFQKPPLFSGLHRHYTPADEAGVPLPDETQNVQQSVTDCLDEIREIMVNLIDLVASQDVTNCGATADVVVDGKVILKNVPVTHLLWLEKQLTDLRTALNAIPVLDPAQTWNFDENVAAYVTPPEESTRTAKVPKTHVKYPATPEHPAQTEMYYEDQIVGRWRTVRSSRAMPAQRKNRLLERIEKLRDAVKIAREEANQADALKASYGDPIFDYLLDID